MPTLDPAPSANWTRSVLRRYSDAWMYAAQARRQGDTSAWFPRRKRHLFPVRWYHDRFELDVDEQAGRGGKARVRIPVSKGRPALWVRLDRVPPYPVEQVRSITLLCEAGRLWLEVTAEVPVATYANGQAPDPARAAGVDLGVIHPFAVAGPDDKGLMVSGRQIRAEYWLHHRDTKKRQRATAKRAPKKGQRGSRRWKKTRARQRKLHARYKRRIRQSMHEAAKAVIEFAVEQRIGTFVVGDPRGVLDLKAGRVHNRRTRDWRIGQQLRMLQDKAELAGIAVQLVDERYVLDLPTLLQACPETERTQSELPALRVYRPPRHDRGGHHRHSKPPPDNTIRTWI